MFNRANHFRQQCEFDKAAQIYERMTAQRDDAELYWSIVLCRYGIEYVDDPLTKKKIATCHRTQYKSILEDADYLEALERADSIQREVYEREAQYIDKVQKGILEISNKEKPFDVFICYKETDENGKRTPDSVLAQELYYGLEREGFKVFFSRITLESKLGTEYEPYIFAALNSAKVMVVVGTKPEYFNAVWVRNEWSRYLMLMQEDRSRTLIPAYKDMDPYDLPDALSMFQAQDMSKLGFMQDLLHGISKIAKDEPKKTEVKETIVKRSSANIENLIKRGALALEDGDWSSANKFYEQILDEDVEEYRAYLGKLCAELNIHFEKDLVNAGRDFSRSDNYKKAYRFADENNKTIIENYNLQSMYNQSMDVFNACVTDKDYINAKEFFDRTPEYSNCSEMSEKCIECANEYIYSLAVEKTNTATDESKLEYAIHLFESIKDYKDSSDRIAEVHSRIEEFRLQQIYNEAQKYAKYNDKDSLKKSLKAFETIIDFKDSREMINKIQNRIDQLLTIEKENDQIRKRRKEISCQIADLGFFSGAKKKSLAKEYEELSKKLEELHKQEVYLQNNSIV